MENDINNIHLCGHTKTFGAQGDSKQMIHQ